jgi:hypothetical protein
MAPTLRSTSSTYFGLDSAKPISDNGLSTGLNADNRNGRKPRGGNIELREN